MSEIMEYIDTYFKKELPAPERLIFETRLESDKDFAEAVAFYISARALMEVEAEKQQKKELDEIYSRQISKKSGIVKKMLPYFSAAAACLILIFGWQFIKAASAKQIAKEFIKKHIQNSPTLMAEKNNKDSLAKGVILFQEKKYDQAERIFQALVVQEKYGLEAIEYLGKVYLIKEQYEQALIQFETLSRDTSIRVNYGSFYKAVTLMRRSADGDVENAKEILNEIIRKGLPGSKEAKNWINKI